MANERLRAAIAEAGLDANKLAELATVDVKTAYRWLGGRTPYARHRTLVARALEKREAELWPEAELAHLSSEARHEIVGAFAQSGDPAPRTGAPCSKTPARRSTCSTTT